VKLQCTANKKSLQDLKDEVKQLELEARRPNQEDSPLTRNIRMLENRLDKAMIKYNEAQSIRKTYEQIVKVNFVVTSILLSGFYFSISFSHQPYFFFFFTLHLNLENIHLFNFKAAER
jgi:hypothetical protein